MLGGGAWGRGGQWSGRQHPGQRSLSLAPPSSPRQDVLCIPAHRLLQDSQDIPVTVTPLRAERVLLFDDALVLLQVGGGAGQRSWGHSGGLGAG